MDSQKIDKAIDWALKNGFSDIKANSDQYETPKSYRKPGSDDPFIPDLTGIRMGNRSFVEIAEKSDNIERKISKWKLLDTLANMKNGKLYLLAPHGNKAFVDRMIKKYHIEAKVVSI